MDAECDSLVRAGGERVVVDAEPAASRADEVEARTVAIPHRLDVDLAMGGDPFDLPPSAETTPMSRLPPTSIDSARRRPSGLHAGSK